MFLVPQLSIRRRRALSIEAMHPLASSSLTYVHPNTPIDATMLPRRRTADGMGAWTLLLVAALLLLLSGGAHAWRAPATHAAAGVRQRRGGATVRMTTAASSALPETPLAKPFGEVIKARFSNGHYKEHQPVPQRVLTEILRLTQRAPSSFNIQPYSLVVVRDPALRARLAKAAMLGAL